MLGLGPVHAQPQSRFLLLPQEHTTMKTTGEDELLSPALNTHLQLTLVHVDAGVTVCCGVADAPHEGVCHRGLRLMVVVGVVVLDQTAEAGC